LLQSEVVINLKNLRSNFRFIQNKMKQKKIMAVVKGNAYGHGISKVASVLEQEGVYGFCVALEKEVAELINLKVTKPILHLGRIHKNMLNLLDTGQVRCNLTSLDDIELIDDYGKSKNVIVNAHLKIDTGMTRLGVQENDIKKCIEKLKKTNHINIEGLWSHLATADENDNLFLSKQISLFRSICDKIKSKFDKINFFHIEPSGSILKYDHNFFNMVRPGISLYGATPLGIPFNELKPVMEFRAPIALTKNISKSTYVGYNRTFKASQDMKIGLVQGGYADGVPTSFSNKGIVSFGSEIAPIIGKVAFDITTIDISNISCSDFDYITFWGGNNDKVRIENIAKICKKIPYELFTGITNRVKRIYIDD